MQVGDKQFFYFRAGDPAPHFDRGAENYVGHHKGMLQVLFERGKYVAGMTADGEHNAYVPENPDAWQPTDLVIRNEEHDDGDMKLALYRVLSVPAEHDDVGSNDDIECEWMVIKKWKGHKVYAPSGKKWVWKANTLTSVTRDSFTIESGKLKNKKQVRITFDMDAFWQKLAVSLCLIFVIN